MLVIPMPAVISLVCTDTCFLVERKYSNMLLIDTQALVLIFKNCLSGHFSLEVV